MLLDKAIFFVSGGIAGTVMAWGAMGLYMIHGSAFSLVTYIWPIYMILASGFLIAMVMLAFRYHHHRQLCYGYGTFYIAVVLYMNFCWVFGCLR